MRRRNTRPAGPARRIFSLLAVIALFAGVAFLIAWLEPETELGGRAVAADGDSLAIGENRIRLLHVDAPEFEQTCKTKAGDDWSCGREARRAMARLLSAGAVTCRGDRHDQYERLLATCSAGGRDLGAALVESGMAMADGNYESEQRAARAAEKGIWQGSFDSPAKWRRRHQGEPFSNPLHWMFGVDSQKILP